MPLQSILKLEQTKAFAMTAPLRKPESRHTNAATANHGHSTGCAVTMAFAWLAMRKTVTVIITIEHATLVMTTKRLQHHVLHKCVLGWQPLWQWWC